MINKRLATVGLLLVIALSASVISSSASSIEPKNKQQQSDSFPLSIEQSVPKEQQSASQKQPQEQQQLSEATIEAKKSDPQHSALVASPESASKQQHALEETLAVKSSSAAEVTLSSSSSSSSPSSSSSAVAAVPSVESASEASKRKAKSAESSATEQKPAGAAATSAVTAVSEDKLAGDNKSAGASDLSAKAKPESAATKPSGVSQKASQKQTPLTAKSGPSKSKLPANLGTVTSTGSGGATHYMSKHDAYSAIAEKHGALAHDAMRKSDKRHGMHSGGGGNPFSSSIQKASGIGEMLNPFKGVTDSGLARTLGASMRSIMKSKYSVPAYVASALLGAVALMAFYESPISPLPVPALPNPPVGRFPPEMPNISPNVQAPFRTNQQQQQQGQWGQQQQNYNQRSLLAQASSISQQQPQQVFFPGNGPQQRQMTTVAGASAGGVASPVQNLAANLLATVGAGKSLQQNAQRKSGSDYDQSTSRSLFGNNSPFATPQKSTGSIGSQPANQNQRQSNAFLSFFGLGGSGSGDQQHSASSGGHHHQTMTSSNLLEPKGSQQSSQASSVGQLSNSHIVNKVKSYFRAPSSAGSSSAAGISNSNPYDQYQRMSFVQALMKDTAFLPGFLTSGNRKSSSPVSSTGSAPAAAASSSVKPSEPASGSNQQVAAAARMQIGNEGQLPKHQQQLQPQQQQNKPASSGSYGIVRVAHALMDSLGTSIVQRNNQPSERKSNSDEQQPLAAATSLLSDLISGYNANVDQQQHSSSQSQSQPQQSKQPQQSQSQPQSQQTQQSPQSQQASAPQQQQQSQASQTQQNIETPQAQARSDDNDEPTIITAEDQLFPSKKSETSLVRKTRSIGYEYPMVEQTPSRAAQINNVIDYVADQYAHNRLLFNFVMNQVGLSQAVPYVEQILAPTSAKDSQ